MFKYVLFDLDGTLTDPFEGITNSIVYALKKFGIGVADRRSLLPFIGPPLITSFKEYYGFSDEEAGSALKYYREYFSEAGMFENRVYEGVPEMLDTLLKRGKTLIMATSKPEVFAVKIAERFGIKNYFSLIAGATLDETRNEKEDVIAYALKKLNIGERDGAVMTGDRKYDIFGAKVNGLKSVGVTYGYGTEEELKNAGADFIARTPHEIINLV